MSEEDKKREYRLFMRRSYGEVEPTSGAPAEIEQQREEWARGRTKKT